MLDYHAFPSVSNPTFEHLWRDFSAYGALPTGAPVVHQRQQSPVAYTRAVVKPGSVGFSFADGSPQYTAMLGQTEVDAAAAAQRNGAVTLAALALLGFGAFYFFGR